ncbi:MAG: efflux RND transporter permease subunit [candidate division Zixibacteria bacterium]|nr:efflux RND transporter permease subunit [candidate division Zixibacteria bacterium]
MHSFFRFFVARHKLANLFTIAVTLLGLYALTYIQRDRRPQVDFGQMTVTTRYPGASSEDVELNVTNKIEEQLKGVRGIEDIVSYSMENMSTIQVNIDPDASDPDEIRLEIREAVGRVTDLPAEVDDLPLVKDIKSSIMPVLEVGITGDIPYREKRAILDHLKKRLEELHGVSSVEKYGYRAREIKIEVKSSALEDYQISLGEIIAAIQGQNIRATAGTFESYTSEKSVVTLAQFRDPYEVGDVIIRSTFEGLQIKVKDLAIIRDDFEDETVISRVNSVPALSLLISKKEKADIIRTVDAVKKAVLKEQKSFPDGVGVHYANDTSHRVRSRMDVVLSNAAMGFVLVILVLTAFLRFRTALWVAFSIPVTLLGVIFLLPAFNELLSSIALAAMVLVLGIIVDDAIVIAENIHRHRENGKSPLDAATEGIREVFAPVVTTILTTALAFIPMFFISGRMGKFIYVIPLVVCLALVVSLFEVTIALPAHIVGGLKRVTGKEKTDSGRTWFQPIQRLFKFVIYYVLRLRYVFVALFIVLFVFSVRHAITKMDFVLFPSGNADELSVQIEMPIGTPLQVTSEKIAEVEQLIDSLLGDELVSSITRVGRGGEFAGVEVENMAQIALILTPTSQRDRSGVEIVKELRQKGRDIPGISKITYSVKSVGMALAGKPITLRVVGSDDIMRRVLADSIVAIMSSMDGIKDIERDDKLGKEQIEIVANRDKLARADLTIADIAQNIRIAYDGQIVTSVRYGEEDVDFRVSLQAKARKSLEYLSQLLIPNKKGRLIPLGEVSDFKTGPGPTNFYHYNGERAVTISASVDQDIISPMAATKRILGQINLDNDWAGMRIKTAGESKESGSSVIELFAALVFAVIGIYFLLILLFNSFSQPLMVLLAIPFGLIGVIGAFVLHDQVPSFVGMLGVIGLAGVVVNDSLVLVNHINRLREQNNQASILQIVIEGTTNRLRPILITTFTTVASLLPLAYGIGGSDEMMTPMALALGYGLLFATFLTLGLVPSFYLIGQDIRKMFKK